MEKIKKWYKEIAKLLYNIKVDRIGECSAQCAYYTILSFIPFIILLITLIQYTNIQPHKRYLKQFLKLSHQV